MPRYVPIGMALWILGTLGCASRGNVDVLESQLRKQEDQIFAIEAQLSQSESELTLARREVQTLRVQLAERGKPTLLPEQSQSLHRLAGVRVQKYFSGGLDRDGVPGDDLLNVVVVPHDEDGETVKSPGELEIEAIDLSAPEDARQLGGLAVFVRRSRQALAQRIDLRVSIPHAVAVAARFGERGASSPVSHLGWPAVRNQRGNPRDAQSRSRGPREAPPPHWRRGKPEALVRPIVRFHFAGGCAASHS